jgi:hypothetical protein
VTPCCAQYDGTFCQLVVVWIEDQAFVCHWNSLLSMVSSEPRTVLLLLSCLACQLASDVNSGFQGIKFVDVSPELHAPQV